MAVEAVAADTVPADEVPEAPAVETVPAEAAATEAGRIEAEHADAPLVLAQRDLTRALALVGNLLAGGAGEPEPPDSDRRRALRELVPRWHFAMLNDLSRNDLFQEAIQDTVGPGDHVLDIGSGSGLLAMLAARSGADRVTSCEAEPVIARAARRVVADNGLAAAVHIVNQRSQDLAIGVDLPRRVDVVTAEIVDCGLVGEGLIPTLRHAREHLMRPGGVLIPHSARLVAAPLDSPSIARLNRVDYACGFDVSRFNDFATSHYFPVRMRTLPYQFLAEPRVVLALDFASDPLEPGEKALEFEIEHDGTCHGMAFWFELALDKKRVLSNEPGNPDCHWHQAFQAFPEVVALRAGARLRVRLAHDDGLVHFTLLGERA